MEIKFNGSEKQNKWVADIVKTANLTGKQIDNLLRYSGQIDNLLRYSGPTMHAQGIMDVTIIIDNRHNLAAYADSLGEFYTLSAKGKHAVAEEAVDTINRN